MRSGVAYISQDIDFNTFTDEEKREIEDDIQLDFDAGLRGIQWPSRSRKEGSLLAFEYYIRLI
jgi:15-cis-phytoene synthase